MRTALMVVGLVFLACSAKKPSAMDVCKKLEADGVAAKCAADTPGGIGAAAKERVTFELPSVPGESGQVLSFEREDFYDSTEKAFAAAAALAGRHQYGSKKALIFVQLNSETGADVGAKAKAIVDGL